MAFPAVLLDQPPARLDPMMQWNEETAGAIRSYAANPLFRSARFDELVLDDAPYRRPVRPDDFEWLTFEQPLTRTTASRLSALLGHRMLLNIYDTRLPLLPDVMSEQQWRDFDLFYSRENHQRGERIRRFLEHHLFNFLHEDTEDAGTDLIGGLRQLAAERAAAADRLRTTLGGATDRGRMATMTAVQFIGMSLAVPDSRVARPTTAPGAGALAARVGALAARLDLRQRPHCYYQFYLPSTLALMNYLGGSADSPRDAHLFAGALTAYRVDLRARLGVLEEATADRPSTVDAERLDRDSDEDPVRTANMIAVRGGPNGVREFARGLSEFTTLLSVHDDELAAQLALIDQPEAHQRKARRLYAAIREHNVPVDLDTFVESCEECSTTHVHDDTRLVVIESGEMRFWTCLGQQIRMVPGDMFYVPQHHLHGSVVLSGECVYHQPVITGELEERFG